MRRILLLCALCAVRAQSRGVGPHGVDPLLDCGVRSLALEFATSTLLPPADAESVALIHDALRLSVDCGAPPPPRASPFVSPRKPSRLTDAAIYYIATTGDDTNPGTEALPFATLPRALRASRGDATPAVLFVRGGVSHLDAPLVLTAADSGLVLQAFEGETPIVSGGVPLTGLAWTVHAPGPAGGMSGPFAGTSVVSNTPGLLPHGNATGIVYAGDFSTASACASACAGAPVCTSYTWHDATCDDYSNECFFRTDGEWAPSSPWPGHYSGQKTAGVNASIWRATLPSEWTRATAAATMNLYDASSGRRMTRAKAPNGNPETTIDGFAAGAISWAPPRSFPPPQDIEIASPSRADDPFFPTFQLGVGGTCAQFEPAEGFWCSSNPPAGSTYNVPTGVTLPVGLLPGTWEGDVSGAFFHAFHGDRWGGWTFALSSANATNGNLAWEWGGFQEARGWGQGDTFMLEGLLDLLDDYSEWHIDASTNTLYAMFNTSTPPGVATTLIPTRLDSLLRLEGNADAPVSNISILGITFSHTSPTYNKSYTMASGGDWSVRKDAAVWLEGTTGVRIEWCRFEGIGGNAVMLYAFNRGAAITHSRFRFVGDSAIVSLGVVSGMDGTAGDYPEGTLVSGNVVSEIGLYTKQSGGYYHALSANASVIGNVFMNMPRAGININDGFAGGHTIVQNLCFNAVRETSDHGCFNSWDRSPLIWDATDVSRLYPAQTLISRNFFINNYHSTWPIDHDDGSNSFLDTFNFLPWGGAKN